VLNQQRVAAVVIGLNCGPTLEKTVADLDRDVVDDVIAVDDASTDDSVEIWRSLGIEPIVHQRSRGCGGSQKSGYLAALDRGADVVVIIHGDHQYSPKLAVPMAAMITCGLYDLVLGSRLLTQDPRDGGMPAYKYVANRALTIAENALADTKVSEFHTGLRAFRASFLRSVPFEANSDTFVFDNEIVLQALAIGAPIGEVTCPTHYADDSSSIDFPGGVRYGLGVMRAGWRYYQWRHGRRRYPFLDITP
jgi:glycosyltransferase involved in cell wall biosynthesis